jgi:hypothetical protein
MGNKHDRHLAAIWQAFRLEPRPEHFTNYSHCCECWDHDETLRLNTRETIGLKELGNGAWDPICFINPAGFMYYFPSMAKLALGRGNAYYLDQFLFHLDSPGRIALFNNQQRQVVHKFLHHIRHTMEKEIHAEIQRVQLARIICDLE